MKMKNITLFTMTIAIFFMSCTKEERPVSPSIYYVKATINGTEIEYNNYTAAVYRDLGLLNVYGFNSNVINSDDGITLNIFNDGSINGNQPIVIGTYSDTANISISSINKYWNPYKASMVFQQSGIDYTNFGIRDPGFITPFTCNITAVDNISVSGTFSGNLYFGYTSTILKTITNGSFKVPF